MVGKFNADQQLAIDNANRERRIRGMPDWDAASFMACNPVKFAGQEPGSLTCDPTPPPDPPLGSRRSNAARAAEEAKVVAEAARIAAEAEANAPPAVLYPDEPA